MHELSICQSVVQTVLEAVPGRRVVAVRLRVGALAAVAPEALDFGWGLVCADTLLEGARLDVDRCPAVTSCRACARRSELVELVPLRCPACGSADVELSGGWELQIESVEVEDSPSADLAGSRADLTGSKGAAFP